MLTLILILLAVYILYRILRRRPNNQEPYPSYSYGGSGMGGMFGGMILGYLLTHYLIDQNQYDMWRSLSDDQLRDTLVSRGILNDADYEDLAGQAAAGTLAYNEAAGNATDWTNDNGSQSGAGFDDYDDGGFGGGDFGGFDQ